MSGRVKDHPRGCGDKFTTLTSVKSSAGSPPRMRGQVTIITQIQAPNGITPADAGTRNFGYCSGPRTWDHPRGCGDKLYTWTPSLTTRGSPPRMRGQDLFGHIHFLFCWITPADAGTRSSGGCMRPRSQDHPRGCGDKTQKSQMPCQVAGSPPRMRGQGAPTRRYLSCAGITPADAGTSTSRTACGSWCGDHPRGCGDKAAQRAAALEKLGSPPRMRGQAFHP